MSDTNQEDFNAAVMNWISEVSSLLIQRYRPSSNSRELIADACHKCWDAYGRDSTSIPARPEKQETVSENHKPTEFDSDTTCCHYTMATMAAAHGYRLVPLYAREQLMITDEERELLTRYAEAAEKNVCTYKNLDTRNVPNEMLSVECIELFIANNRRQATIIRGMLARLVPDTDGKPLSREQNFDIEFRLAVDRVVELLPRSAKTSNGDDPEWFCISPDGLGLFPFDNEEEARKYSQQTGMRLACTDCYELNRHPQFTFSEVERQLLERLSTDTREYDPVSSGRPWFITVADAATLRGLLAREVREGADVK